MFKLSETLFRMGDEVLEIIGRNQMRLLKASTGDSQDQDALVNLALNLHGEVGLLRNEETRRRIISSLSKNDAYHLAMVLGIEHNGRPFGPLLKQKFRKNSKIETMLFKSFGVEIHEEEVAFDTPETVTEVEAKHGLFPHQRNALVKIDRILQHEGGRVVLHMPTGSGKTRTAMNMICKQLNDSKGVVLWLAHSEELCEQAAQEFETAWSFLGDRTTEVRRFYKNHNWEETEDGLIVAGLSKLWSHLTSNQTAMHWLAQSVSLIVFDEAHQSIAPTYREPVEIILKLNPECRFLGLTATPGRTWNDIDKDMELSNFYNNKKVSLEVEGYDSPIHYLVEEGYLSKTEFHDLDYEGSGEIADEDFSFVSEGREVPQDILDAIASDGMRNAMIMEKVAELISRGHERILVFAVNVQHAHEISSFLNFMGIKSDCVTGTTEEIERKNAISRFKRDGGDPRVLCNFGVLTTGFDAPRTSAAVIARPTTSLVLYSQMVGRAIRGPKVRGTEKAEIWTVVDTNLPGFDSIPGAFTNWEDVW